MQYKDLDSGYRFYYPYHLVGDAFLYEQLETQSWYYMEWKWEHQVVFDRLTPKERILEVGCGRGEFLRRLRSRNVVSVGLELNEHAANAATHTNLDVRVQSLKEHAKDHQGLYDWVCAFQVLEHIPQPAEFLCAAIDCLKPGGRLAICIPNNESPLFTLEVNQALNLPPHHMALWDVHALISLGRYFPLRIDDLLIEPLQHYHLDWLTSLATNRVVRRFGQNDPRFHDHFINHTVQTAITIQTILENGPGHSILAIFTKESGQR
jgi:SAM-dependent methyltransferase